VGLRITTNILSLSTQRSLALTTRALARSLQRLASGSRINTGRDDPAGLAMASGLESQRRGMLQAVRNINDSRGFLETADGAMAEQTNMLQRMRELAVQASNGTLNDTTRAYLNNEFQTLLTEFNRITTQTQFNGLNLLDGSFGTKNIQVGSQKGHTIAVGLTSMMTSQVFTTTTTTTTSGSSSTVGTGTFKVRTTMDGPSRPFGIAIGDTNGDGKVDIINADINAGLNLYLGNGNGTFGSNTALVVGSTPQCVILLDLNGDSKLDIVSADYGDLVLGIRLGNGNGTFLPRTTTANNGSANLFVTSADFNGDGKIDLVTADCGNDTVTVLLGNGNGTFLGGAFFATGDKPEDLIVGDFNGDGKIDIITGDSLADTNSILLGNGNGTFKPRTTVAAGDYPQGLAAADFNGDGKLDFITADSNANTVSIYIGNGNGTFNARTTVRTGTYPDSVRIADFNGDGKLDIFTPDQNSNVISIFIANGNGTFAARTTLAPGTAPTFANASDLNGDGVIDIVVSDYLSSTLSVFIGNSTSVVTVGGTTTATTLASMYLTTQTNAQDALSVLDGALAYVNSARANIGALQSRLDFAASVNQNTIENISAARSQIMDTDMAAETAEFSRLQILQRAGIAVLGQANMTTQLTLKLLETL
jgi:flagellin-like hook-associated protein FlgL